MKRELHDLRVLKLAEMYERAFERFVLEIAQGVVRDESIRERLMALVTPSDGHDARIAAHITRLNARLRPEDQADVELAALEDVLEVEHAARAFYLARADDLHDPEVVRLFRELAAEEEQHARLAREALAMAEAKAGRVRVSPPRLDLEGHRLLRAKGGPA